MVLFSGGLDSTAALHWTLARYPRVAAIGFDYGQPNRNCELPVAGAVAARLGVGYFVAALADSISSGRPAGLLRGVVDHDPAHTGLHPAFVPGRNIIFLSIAAAHAAAVFPNGNVDLIIGANKDDAAGFPDCRGTALVAMGVVLRHALAREIQVRSPFLEATKRNIVTTDLPDGALDDVRRSWSCYRGDGPCGACTACVLRAEAFAAADIEDLCARPTMRGGDPARDAKVGH